MPLTKVFMPDMVTGMLPFSMIEGAVLNVLDYGAVGDNVHDDTAAFEAAIAAAAPYKTIYIPNGTYKITSTLTITSSVNCSFIGESKAGTVIYGSGFTADENIFNFAGTSIAPIQNIQFKNMSIWSNNNLARGITAVWVNKSIFENLYFYNLYTGLYGDYAWSNSFRSIETYGITGATVILNNECNDVHFDRVSFTGSIAFELLQGGASLVFTACDFSNIGSTGYGAYIHPSTGYLYRGIVFNGCYFENMEGTAISLNGADSDSISSVSIKGCYINGNTATSANGIVLHNVTGFDISDNYFYAWTATAIYRDSTESNGRIENNTLISTPALTQTSNQASPSVKILNNTYGHKELTQDAAPTTGTYVVGDIVWRQTTLAGGYMGWVCTTSGTPGTWKTFGAISA